MSNKPEVFKNKQERENIKHYFVEETVKKTLGVFWNVKEDTLQYVVNIKQDDHK